MSVVRPEDLMYEADRLAELLRETSIRRGRAFATYENEPTKRHLEARNNMGFEESLVRNDFLVVTEQLVPHRGRRFVEEMRTSACERATAAGLAAWRWLCPGVAGSAA